jgi:secondary thiamine-phosphate synthase enzyme
MSQTTLTIQTPGRGLHDIGEQVGAWVATRGSRSAICHLFLQHTSASLTIQENADPDVLRDLVDWFVRAAPDGDPRYRHVDEGPDDMSAHIRTSLTDTALTIPVVDGRLALGTWQGIYLFEHRTRPHRRRIVVSLLPLID